MKIGIIGGTFDPPHIGHLVIAEQAYFQLGLDVVWFAPVGQPPHKTNNRVSPVTHRIEMTRLSIKGNPHFILSTADVDRPAPHYITVLFDMLVAQQPDTEWHLIIGADSLTEMPRWYQPQRLLQLTRLAVAARVTAQPDMDTLETALPGIGARVDWLDCPMIDLASRELQRRVVAGLPIRYMVHEDAENYITSYHLYTSQ
jgi:nicotinate-nucleotide adenylyltransferase